MRRAFPKWDQVELLHTRAGIHPRARPSQEPRQSPQIRASGIIPASFGSIRINGAEKTGHALRGSAQGIQR